jgi:predicted Zn-dependent protease
MKRLAVVALLVACVSAVGAQPHDSGMGGPSETLLRAMQDEMERTLEHLRLENLSEPYFLAYTVLETQRLELQGNFGALERPLEASSRRIQVEVRTGSREFDDRHFVGSQGQTYRPMTGMLPVEDDYDALRAGLWALTDKSYKAALERLARKTVYRESNNIVDVLPDLSEDPVRSSVETLAAGPFERETWEPHIRDVSAVFRNFPAIQSSSVDLHWRAQHVYFVDSEGRSYVKPGHWFELRMKAAAQAADGMILSDDRQMVWSAHDHVPPVDALKAAAEQLARDLTALADAPKIATYLGPVLLEGQAAGEFFSQLLASGVANPREVWVEQKWSRQHYKTGALTKRLGLRVIAPIFDVVDDPTRAEFRGRPLTGHYKIDEQGIPAQRVQLVERGILRDLLMSRSPTQERKLSNGHGRGGFFAPATAMIGSLFVTPATTMSFEAMKRRLREEAKAFGLGHGILIRRITEERKRSRDDLLAPPVLVYEVDVETGEERLVRDAVFSAVTLRALRDIVAASNEQHVYNLAKPGPFASSATSRASIVHPSVLLAEMELVETERKPSKPPYLKHPFFDTAAKN